MMKPTYTGKSVGPTSGAKQDGISTNIGTSNEEKVEQTMFIDENVGDMLNYNPISDSTFYDDQTQDAGLADYLSRPVLIQSLSWTEGGSISGTFLPWQLFFNNTAIKKKLDNYAFISCNLKLKIMINASPFYYGALMFCYKPMTDFATNSIDTTNSTATQIWALLSQRPKIMCYPQYCQGGEMVLPYINYRNWIPAGQSYQFYRMGAIDYQSIGNLLNANSVAGTDVDVQIYAWAEDVRLSGPTYQLSSQVGDEYVEDEGVVSAPAIQIAAAAGAVSPFLPPMLKPFALATSLVADATASVAKLFGYTNVPVIASVHGMKNLPFHSLASADISQPVEKLTVDDKNELSIDPRIAGLNPMDELAISHIVTRETIILNRNWTAADTLDTLLFSARVMPNLSLHNTIPATSELVVSRPFCAHVAELFSMWRGDVIFKFRFICTRYHKGRVRITWDPWYDIQNTGDTKTVCYNRIVDIAQENVLEVRVPYAQSYAWLDCARVTSDQFSAGVCPARSETEDNGVITMRVLTQQTAPVSSADVSVIVSVRMAENAEFSEPRELVQTHSFFQPQSADEFLADDDVCCHMYDGGQSKEHSDYSVYVGEVIPSLRKLLRRSSLSFVVSASDGSVGGDISVQLRTRIPRLPPFYGYVATGVATANDIVGVGTSAFNFCNEHPINHVGAMFLCSRGSVIWHKNCTAHEPALTMRCTRYPNAITAGEWRQTNVRTVVGFSNPDAQSIQNFMTAGAAGTSLLNQRTQAGMSVYAPYYSRTRFQMFSPTFRDQGTNADRSNVDNLQFDSTYHVSINAAGEQSEYLISEEYYCGIGTDFSLFFLVNVPSVYYYSSQPVVI